MNARRKDSIFFTLSSNESISWSLMTLLKLLSAKAAEEICLVAGEWVQHRNIAAHWLKRLNAGNNSLQGHSPVVNDELFENDKPLFEKWKRNIPRGGVDLIPGCLVCEVHFPEESIVRHIETTMVDGTVSKIKKSKPTLKPGAVPTIFPNLPPHLYRTLKRVSPPNTMNSIAKKQKDSYGGNTSKGESQSISNNVTNGCETTILVNNHHTENSQDSPSKKINKKNSTGQDSAVKKKVSSVLPLGPIQLPAAKINESQSYEEFAEEFKKSFSNKPIKSTPSNVKTYLKKSIQRQQKYSNDVDKTNSAILSNSVSPDKIVSVPQRRIVQNECPSTENTDRFQIIIAEGENDDPDKKGFTFRHLKDNIEDLKVPSWHWSCSFLRNSIAFIDWGTYFETRKKVIVNYDMKYKVFIKEKEVFIKEFDKPRSFQDLQNFLLLVDKISICQGREKGEEKQWSKNCFGFVPPREEGTKKLMKIRCDECLIDMKNAPSSQKRDEEKLQKRIQKLTVALSAEKLKNRGLTSMIQKLRQRIEKLSCNQTKTSKLLELSKSVEAILNEGINDDEEIEAVVEESIIEDDENGAVVEESIIEDDENGAVVEESIIEDDENGAVVEESIIEDDENGAVVEETIVDIEEETIGVIEESIVEIDHVGCSIES